MLIALVLLLAPLQAVPDRFEEEKVWAEFSRSPARPGAAQTLVQIASAAPDGPGGRIGYILRRTVTRPDGVVVDWAESRNCPAIRRVMIAMRRIRPPRPNPFGLDDRIVVIGDGISYRLRAPSRWNDYVTFTSNTDTPLARWVEKSLAALAPCWSPKRPAETL
jgi:hypothetical protein